MGEQHPGEWPHTAVSDQALDFGAVSETYPSYGREHRGVGLASSTVSGSSASQVHGE